MPPPRPRLLPLAPHPLPHLLLHLLHPLPLRHRLALPKTLPRSKPGTQAMKKPVFDRLFYLY